MKKISTLKTIVPIIITLAIVACSKNDTAVNNHQVIDLADLTADYIAQDGDILTGKLDFTNHFIKISILLSSNNKDSIKIIELHLIILFFESFKLTKVFKSSRCFFLQQYRYA